MKKYIYLAMLIAVFVIVPNCSKSPNQSNKNDEATTKTESVTTGNIEIQPEDKIPDEKNKPIKTQIKRKNQHVSSQSIPAFPIPVPQPSREIELTKLLSPFSENISKDSLRLKDIDKEIIEALSRKDYEYRYFSFLNDGFALVTKLEKINDDGSPDTSNRWSDDLNYDLEDNFSIQNYLHALFNAPVGMFRVIVFTVSAESYKTTGEITKNETEKLMEEGLSSLPSSIAELPYTSEHRIRALIYQFEKKGNSDPEKADGKLTAREHLVASGIIEADQTKEEKKSRGFSCSGK